MEAYQYWFVIIWVGAMVLIIERMQRLKHPLLDGDRQERVQLIAAMLTILPVIVLAAFRANIGDTETYREMFHNIPSNLPDLISYLKEVGKDKGFFVLSGLLKLFVGSSDVVYFLILAAVMGFCIVSAYRRYSPSFGTSMFLFIASTDYISWMFNGMRQFLAASLLFAICIGLFLRKKYWLSAIAIVVLSTIHASALIMLPALLVVGGKAFNWRAMVFIGASIAIAIFAEPLTTLLGKILQGTQYDGAVSHWVEDDGTNAIRVAVYIIPTLFAVFGRKRIQQANNPLINLCVNMSVLSAGFYIISMATSGIYVGRIPIYFSLYNYILLPWEIKNLFPKKYAKLLFCMLVVCYLVFYYFQVFVVWKGGVAI